MSGKDFWSRRREAVAAEEGARKRDEELAETSARQAEFSEKTDEEILEELGLPDPDGLEPGDDFRGFLNTLVPERLRRRALRRLWRINPVLANLDGLVDYAEDFTDAATVLEAMTSTYEVGRGMAEHVRHAAARLEEMAKPEGPNRDPDKTGTQEASELGTDVTDREQAMSEEVKTAPATRGEAERDATELEPEPDEGQRNSYARPVRMRYAFES